MTPESINTKLRLPKITREDLLTVIRKRIAAKKAAEAAAQAQESQTTEEAGQ